MANGLLPSAPVPVPQLRTAPEGFNLMSLLPFAPLLGGLMGLFAPTRDPFREFQRMQQRLQGELPAETGRLYRAFLASPAYAGAVRGLTAGSQALQSRLATSLGQRGLTGTGIGAIAGPLAASQFGGQMAGLQATAWGQAQEDALRSLQQRYGVAGGLAPSAFGGPEKLAGLMQMLTLLPLLYPQQRR